MADDTTQTTLRDHLENAFDKVETQPVEQPIETKVETSEQKAERLRDEQGRFAPEKESKIKQPSTTVKAKVDDNVPRETQPKPQRPSSWKKEMWPVWDKLTNGSQISPEEALQLAEYNNQREQDFAKGVSTYKQEWESAKPLLDVMAQFKPLLDQHGIKPTDWINNLGNAHKQLVMGTHEQKLSMFVKLAQDYQVPLQALFSQGQDGKIYFNPQIQSYQAPQAQQDPRAIVHEILEEERAKREVQSFASSKDYPHFELVKDTMSGLIQAGLATDLKSAYESAIRMPMHSELFDQLQQQQRDKEEQEKREQNARQVQGARAKAVSLKTSTPAGPGANGERKGRRETLESAYDEVMNARV
jgi:hypothetical protein